MCLSNVPCGNWQSAYKSLMTVFGSSMLSLVILRFLGVWNLHEAHAESIMRFVFDEAGPRMWWRFENNPGLLCHNSVCSAERHGRTHSLKRVTTGIGKRVQALLRSLCLILYFDITQELALWRNGWYSAPESTWAATSHAGLLPL